MLSSRKIDIKRWSQVASESLTDEVAMEEPLQISVNDRNISVTMRTPGNDDELAIGFLFTEGLLQSADQVSQIMTSNMDANHISVILSDGVSIDVKKTDRNFYSTSSCGVCGKTGIDAIKTVSQFKSAESTLKVSPALIQSLPSKLRQHQQLFQSTGGLHASALFIQEKLVLLREDVGRHNALDKLIGNLFLNNRLPAHDSILVLSGRASFELVQKAAMAGIGAIVAIGAPSSLAVETAAAFGITLIGFAREKSFNVYTGSQRVL